MITTFFKHLLIVVLTLMLHFLALAQKLPAVQQNGKKAIAKVRVDGKLIEWDKPLAAYNNSTEIFYTIANDANNLYFAIQPKDMVIVKKIIAGGVTVTLNNAGKKGLGGVAVTFPMIAGYSQTRIGLLLSEPPMASDSVGKKRQTDSLTRLLNSEFNRLAKEIKVTGVSAIPDLMLSVYNDTGIKAAAFFDDKHMLTYEMAIPLKYLEFLQPGQASFHYQIMLNGLDSVFKPVTHNTEHGPVVVRTVPRGIGSDITSTSSVISFPTDFWGEYTLVK